MSQPENETALARKILRTILTDNPRVLGPIELMDLEEKIESLIDEWRGHIPRPGPKPGSPRWGRREANEEEFHTTLRTPSQKVEKILSLRATGLTYQKIAEELDVSVSTISRYVAQERKENGQ